MRRAFSAARASSVFSCSCVERSQLIVCRALSVGIFAFLVCRTFSVARVSSVSQLLVCRAFSVACVSCVFVTPLFAVARVAESAFNLAESAV